MSIYLLLELAVLAAVILLYASSQDWLSVDLLMLASIPFSPPGLSDEYAFITPTNDPLFGGATAICVGFIFLSQGKSWHIAVASLCALVALWSVVAKLNMVSPSTHGGGLEVLFYGIMIIAIWEWLERYDIGLPRWINQT